MGKITTVGIDLAKNVFSVHAVDENGAVLFRKSVTRARLAALVAQWPACLIGMEACSGAHEWARRFQVFGHTVRIMAARFVAPYRLSGKNDGNDAEAICEAVQRPSMRFVPVKSAEQQAVLSIHRVRQGFVEERTATINRIRGVLAEFGVVLPLRAAEVRRGAAGAAENCAPRWIPGRSNGLLCGFDVDDSTERRGLGHGVSAFAKRLDVKFNRVPNELESLFPSFARGNASGQVGNIGAV